MTLLARFTTLLKADAHGVVEAVEDRSLILKQHLREAEAELLRKRAELAAIDAETRSLDETRKRLSVETKRLDEDAALALAADKEELARFAVRKLLTVKRRSEEAKRRMDRLGESRSRLAETLERQEQAFGELEARVKGFLARAKQEVAGSNDPLPDPVVADEEVEIELLRRRGGA